VIALNIIKNGLLVFLLTLVFSGCGCSNSNKSKVYTDSSGKKIHLGGQETFRYWAETEPTPETEVLNGQYWSSSHFTKEYILYMEIKAFWIKDFAPENRLQRADSERDFPNDAPNWFKPPNDYEVWKGDQGSRYFINSATGHMFMYEIQL